MPEVQPDPKAGTSTAPIIAPHAPPHFFARSAQSYIAENQVEALAAACGEPFVENGAVAMPASRESASTAIRNRTRRNLFISAGIATAAATLSTFSPSSPAKAQEPQPRPPSMQQLRLSSNTGLPAIPTLPVIVLNRMAYGPRPDDIAAFNALASSEEARLTAYVDQQLNPASIDDSACDAIINTQGFTTLNKSLTQLWADHVKAENNPWENRMRPATEIEQVTFLKAVYSKRQLEQVLAEHWFNHFNIYGWDSWTGPVMVHYDRDVIRANMLGNFRTMLEAVAKSPAMLYYLDNQSNSGGNPNENYARELFELHALGAENYLGVVPLTINPDGSYTHPAPKDGAGQPLLYVDADVYGATTCFTGWRIDTQTGTFVFDDDAHFPYAKIVFGRLIPEAQGAKDGSDVLDLVAKHPGTARYICRKLCRRLISDDPPESIVQAAADVFLANVNAADQLKKVTRTILLSTEFRTTWGQKIKRPFEFTVSTLRAAEANFTPKSDFLYTYDALGQPLLSWGPPNGYPDDKESWSSTMPMLQRWRLIHFLVDWKVGGEGSDKDDRRLRFTTPASIKTPNAVVSYWANRLLGYALPTEQHQAIVEFFAAGRNADLDLPESQLTERLPYMIALIFMAPSFQWR